MKTSYMIGGVLFTLATLFACDSVRDPPTGVAPEAVGEMEPISAALEEQTGIVVAFMSSDFSHTEDIVGFGWTPGGEATLEVDNGADGIIDFTRTTTVGSEGSETGVARFQDYTGPPPFSVTEGDIVRINGAATHHVQYMALVSVNLGADRVCGLAREGTTLSVRAFDPGLPFPGGPDRVVTADASETWCADFSASYDIQAGDMGWAVAPEGDGHTQFHWTAPDAIEAAIDIKPGSDPNSINCRNPNGMIAVAILTTDDFDATTVDHTTVTFEGASEAHVDKKTGEARRQEEDVDYDGDIDLVFHFRGGDTNLTCTSTEGMLEGETFDGVRIEGTDAVRMIGEGDCWPPPSGLVGWWPGDGNADDIVGEHHGTTENGAAFAPGMVGDAFAFDGVAGRVTIPDHDDFTLGSDPFSIDMWVRFTTVFERSAFIAHDEGGGEENKWWFIYDAWGHDKPSGPALRFHINSPTLPPTDAVSAPWEPNTGQWYHVAVTRHGSNYALYIDGVQVATDIDDTEIPDAETALTIGEAEGYLFHGLIDEVEVADRALSPEEIQAIYAAGSAGKCKSTNR